MGNETQVAIITKIIRDYLDRKFIGHVDQRERWSQELARILSKELYIDTQRKP